MNNVVRYALIRTLDNKIINHHADNELFHSVDDAIQAVRGNIAHSAHCHPSEIEKPNIVFGELGVQYIPITKRQRYTICPVKVIVMEDSQNE